MPQGAVWSLNSISRNMAIVQEGIRCIRDLKNITEGKRRNDNVQR